VARFQTLSQVGLVLVEVIEAAVPAATEVRLNVPIENPASAAAAVRVTLLWTTPQPGHRSDPPERNPDGTMAPPPPTLTAWYVISTYGFDAAQNAVDAHDLLGRIIRAFHVQPTLTLPIAGMGEGDLHVTQVPLDPELSEKVWVPLQVRQRPWALFEAAPVQLLRTDPAGPVQPVVRPGGVRLGPVEAVEPPRIARISPAVAGRGGRIRIDGAYLGAPARVTIGGTQIVPPDVSAMEPGGPVLVQLPAGLVEGTYDATLTGAITPHSDPATLTIVDPARPSIDAPIVLRHSRANPLVLDGRALGVGAVNVIFWPDAGIAAPSDVVTVAGNAATISITIPAAALAPLRNTLYRISLQAAPHVFTPYVVLEMTP
jgi:hypothetical protein